MGEKFPILAFLALMVILTPMLSQAEEPLFDSKAATQHIEKGIVHLQQKNYDSAIKEFEEASTISPDAEAFYYLGYAYYMKGKVHDDPASRKKSIENFDRAYELNPNFTPSSPALLEEINRKSKKGGEVRQPESQAKPEDAQESSAVQPNDEAQPPVQDTPVDAIFRGNIQRTGVYDTAGAPDVKKEKWWMLGTGKRIFTSPAVLGDTVYVTDEDGALSAYAVANGKKKWTHKGVGGAVSSPAIANNIMFMAEMSGALTAFDLKAQKTKWKYSIGSRIDTSPAIYNGTVYVGSFNTHLYAVDMNTGLERWRFKAGGPIYASPAISDGLIFFSADDDHFYALDALTGKVKWKFKIIGFARSTPAVSDGLVFFKSGTTIQSQLLHAVETSTGQEKWKIETLKNYKPGDIEQIRQYNSGSPEDMDKSLPLISSSPAVANSLVYFGSGDGHLYAVDLQTGAEKWKFEAGTQLATAKARARFLGLGAIRSSPIICEGIVYFGTMNGILFALDAATGEERWKFSVGPMVGSPVLAEGTVYAGTYGRIYALQ